MAVSEAQKKASIKYLEKLDEIRIRIPKGAKAKWKDAASSCSKSLNQYIVDTVEGNMAPETAPVAAETPQGASAVFLPPDTLRAAQEAARAAGETVPEFVGRAVTVQAQRDKLTRMLKATEEAAEHGD